MKTPSQLNFHLKELLKTKNKKQLLIIILFVTLFLISIPVVIVLNKDVFDTRKDASAPTETRVTLADIEGHDLVGTELDSQIALEDEYVDKVTVYDNFLDLFLSNVVLDPTNPETLNKKQIVDYKETFGFDMAKLSITELNDLRSSMRAMSQTNDNSSNLKAETERSIVGKVNAAEGGGSIPEIGKRNLPSIEGFNVEKFTGIAKVDYPLTIPPMRGKINYSVGLSYSSRIMDDLRVNKDFANLDADPEAKLVTGLGWELTSLPMISQDPRNHREMLLNMSGENVRIKYDTTNSRYYTAPETNFKISRLSNGRWKVIDQSGTSYIFGDTQVESGEVIPTSHQHYTGGSDLGECTEITCNFYCWMDTTGWYLSSIIDVYGNSLELEVNNIEDSKWIDADWATGGCNMNWTKDVRITKVKYNYNETQSRFMSSVDFSYHGSIRMDNGSYVQTLDKVEMKNDGLTYGKYEFSYTKTYVNPKAQELKSYPLLTKITKREFGGATGAKPYTFCYGVQSPEFGPNWAKVCADTDVSTTNSELILDTIGKQNAYKPNHIYLTTANNGYGGEVKYFYELVNKVPKVCYNDKDGSDEGAWTRVCSTDNVNLAQLNDNDPIWNNSNFDNQKSSFYRVSKALATNGTVNDLGSHAKLKVTKYEYIGTAEGYADDISPEESSVKINGLSFLGYPTVRIKSYEPNSLTDLDGIKTFGGYTEESTKVSISRGAFTYTHVVDQAQATCYMSDPRKGTVHESKILTQNGEQIGIKTLTPVVTKRAGANINILDENGIVSSCRPDAKNRFNLDVYTKTEYSESKELAPSTAIKKTQSEKTYDFEFDTNATRSFGNVVKTKDFGLISDPNDDIYSYSKFITGVAAYNDKNLTNLPVEAFTTNRNANSYAEIDAIPETVRFGYKKMFYDETNSSLGYQSGVSGVRGMPSTEVVIYYGTGADTLNEKKVLASRVVYDKYANPVKTLSPVSVPATTVLVANMAITKGVEKVSFFDNQYFTYPVCQVQASNKTVTISPTDQNTNCQTSTGSKFVSTYDYAKVEGNQASWLEGLARGLVYSAKDVNGAKTKYDYDSSGRITFVYNPDPLQRGVAQTTAASQVTYYDNLVPMRTRIKTTTKSINASNAEVNVVKTVDSFYDGFGNQLESITYDNHFDKKEANGTYTRTKYALYSRSTFNGTGQVITKLDNVKLINKSLPTTQPIKITDAELTQAVIAEASKTDNLYDIYGRLSEMTVSNGDLVVKEKKTYDGYITRTDDTRGTRSLVEVDARNLVKRDVVFYCDSTKELCNANTGGRAITKRTEYHPVLLKPVKVFDNANRVMSETTYNTAEMVMNTTDVDKGLTKYYYDELGRSNMVKNGKDVSVTTTYDDLNRTKIITTKLGATVKRIEENEYDTNKLGKLYARKLKDYSVSQTNLLEEQRTEYDYAGNTTKTISKVLDLTNPAVLAGTQTKYIEVTKESTYTGSGILRYALAKVKNPNFNNGTEYTFDSLAYRYNDDGNLITVKDRPAQSNYIADIKYGTNQEVNLLSLGNNSKEEYVFDRMKRLTNKKITDGGNAQIYDFTYGYEVNNGFASSLINKIYSNTNAGERSMFKYDSLGRLEGTVSDPQNTEYSSRYVFDDAGNLKVKEERTLGANPVESNASTYYIADEYYGQNKYDETACEGGEYASIYGYRKDWYACPYHAPMYSTVNGVKKYFIYDNVGNLAIEKAVGGQIQRTYKYDVLDMPTELIERVDGTMKTIAKYYYGFGGERIAKLTNDTTNNSVKRSDVYLGDYQYSKEGTVYKELKYVESTSGKIVKEREAGQAFKKNYYYTNQQGSTTFVLDEQGAKLPEFVSKGSLRYFPYGEQITTQDISKVPVKDTYTGQKKDLESDLMFYNARLYDPTLGVFLQADSVADGLNRYMYVGGNPVNKTDPTGKCPVCVWVATEFILRPHNAGESIAQFDKGNFIALQGFLETHPNAEVYDEGGTWMVSYFEHEKNRSDLRDAAGIVFDMTFVEAAGALYRPISPAINRFASSFSSRYTGEAAEAMKRVYAYWAGKTLVWEISKGDVQAINEFVVKEAQALQQSLGKGQLRQITHVRFAIQEEDVVIVEDLLLGPAKKIARSNPDVVFIEREVEGEVVESLLIRTEYNSFVKPTHSFVKKWWAGIHPHFSIEGMYKDIYGAVYKFNLHVPIVPRGKW